MDARERIVAFIPDYAAYLINRLSQGSDGKAAYERMKGKQPTVIGIEFGEKVLYKLKHAKKIAEDKYQMGAWDFRGGKEKKQ